MVTAADTMIVLTGRVGDEPQARCQVQTFDLERPERCTGTTAHHMVLVFCRCPEKDGEHGHPGRADDFTERHQVGVCCRHADTVELWPACESSVAVQVCDA